jgi:hypothetical protein
MLLKPGRQLNGTTPFVRQVVASSRISQRVLGLFPTSLSNASAYTPGCRCRDQLVAKRVRVRLRMVGHRASLLKRILSRYTSGKANANLAQAAHPLAVIGDLKRKRS